MLRIVHVITSLHTGGAQMMLVKLLQHMDRNEFRSEVISLAPLGPIAELVRPASERVTSVDMRPSVRGLAALTRLRALLREARPDVVQTWMYHADIFGGVAAKSATDAPVIWNIRSGRFDRTNARATHRLLVKAGAMLSRRIPKAIVGNSERALAFHAAAGYDATRFVLIPNGFDLEQFAPDAEARVRLRRELGLADDALVVGLVARFDPMKDHATFLEAAARVQRAFPDGHFVLCGDGVSRENDELRATLDRLTLNDRCHLLGRRMDIPAITAALDVACSSSSSEAFPNSLGEAMACAVPVVATDVGDSAMLVGETGRIVPPRDPEAFAAAVIDLLRDPGARRRLGEAARARVADRFEIGAIARHYESLYRDVTSR